MLTLYVSVGIGQTFVPVSKVAHLIIQHHAVMSPSLKPIAHISCVGMDTNPSHC